MLLFSLLSCPVILNQMKTQEPCSASGVVSQRVEVWGELDVTGRRFCFSQGPPELWLRATVTAWEKAGSRPRGQNRPNILCSKYTTLQNHNGFLREQKETWRIMDKPDTWEELKNGEGFFHNCLCCSLWYFFIWEQPLCPFQLLAHGFFGWIECYMQTTRLNSCFEAVQVLVFALES